MYMYIYRLTRIIVLDLCYVLSAVGIYSCLNNFQPDGFSTVPSLQ